MHRPHVITFGKHGVNYDKNASDPRIKSFWVTGEQSGNDKRSVQPSGDIREICGPLAGHVPALCNPTVEAAYPLHGNPNGTYVDCTFGRGGHSVALLMRLGPKGSLYSFDVDPEAVAVGRKLEQKDARFHMVHQPFSSLTAAIPADVELSGVLMDLGFSSPQMDYRFHEGPLDLRYNPLKGSPASRWMSTLSGPELSWLVRQHGEEEDPLMCARIGEAIHQYQVNNGEIQTTKQLENLIVDTKRGLDDRSQLPSKLAVQAIRSWINHEFFEFEKVLEGAFQRLKYGGRCAVICFKRQETMLLTKFVTAHEEPDPELVEGWPRDKVLESYPLLKTSKTFSVRVVSNPIAPTEEELLYNNRARSARTHVLEKQRRRVRWTIPANYKPRAVLRRPNKVPAFGGNQAASECPELPPEMPAEDIYCQYFTLAPPTTAKRFCRQATSTSEPDLAVPATSTTSTDTHADVSANVKESDAPPIAGDSASSSSGKNGDHIRDDGALDSFRRQSTPDSVADDAIVSGPRTSSCAEGAAAVVGAAGTAVTLTNFSDAVMASRHDLHNDHDMSIESWLRKMDNGTGALLIYQQALESSFVSLQVLKQSYSLDDGCGFDSVRFCQEHSIQKLGHRRLFERWAKKHSQ